MAGPIDLSQLPAPAVIQELNYEDILAERKASLLSRVESGRVQEVEATLERESEPLTMLLEENAYRELVWRKRVNEAARAVMLAYAEGTDLENLVANSNIERQVIREETDDEEAVYESDPDLRSRAQQAWEGLSVAGPRSAYEFHALSADGDVADATAITPAPAEVTITVLSRTGDGSASQTLLDAVESVLSGEDTRPVGDRITVQAAEIIDYEIDAVLEVEDGPEKDPIIEAATANVNEYKNTQRRLGRSIRRSALFRALHVEGVRNVVLNAPADDVVLDKTQAGNCTSMTITSGSA